MSLLHSGSFTFVRDAMNEAKREIEEAHELTDIYSMEDLLELLEEAIKVQDALYDHAREHGMISV